MTTSVPEQIDTAAGAIRTANHAAIGSGLSAPETSAVVGGLGELAHRLPQLLDHVPGRCTTPTP